MTGKTLLTKALLGYFVHLASMLCLPLFVPAIAAGTPFLASMIVTVGLFSVAAYLFAIYQMSEACDKLTKTVRTSIKTQRIAAGVFLLLGGVWGALPLFTMSVYPALAYATACFALAAYVATFILSITLNPNYYR